MAKILAVGIATFDIINLVADYPCQDTEVRALSQRVSRGGNATNTLVVLSQLGHQGSWAGVWVDEPDGKKILEDLMRYKIDSRFCRIESQGKMPTSYVILNQSNGSRTIVHYRNLAEFNFTDFQKIDLSTFDWLHFEGRQVEETVLMLQRARQLYPSLPISIEIEKPRPQIERLFSFASVLLFSRNFVQHRGYHEAPGFLRRLRPQLPQTRLICAWGERGGYGLEIDGPLLHSPSYPPRQVIDTLGAGDTFNASIIDSLCHQQELATALHDACRLAGKKCGQVGLAGLSRD